MRRGGALRRDWKASATAIVVVALVSLAVACGGVDDAPTSDVGAFCGAAKTLDVNIASTDVIETSGIAASRRDDNILWAHNDSGDEARFFAIDRTTGAQLATFTLAGVTAIDWEDMAIGPGPVEEAPYLYLADIGDNAAQRPEVTVYRVREPEVTNQPDTPSAQKIVDVDTLTFRYPDHPHDAETFMVDPVNGDLIIVTKELSTGVSFVFRAPSPDGVSPSGPVGAHTLTQVGQIDFKSLRSSFLPGPDTPPLVAGVPFLPTGGDISPDGSLVIIRTYGSIWVWTRPEGATAWEAFSSSPAEVPPETEQQGEAIAFDPDGAGYVTVSEGSNPPLHHFRAQEGAACETPTP